MLLALLAVELRKSLSRGQRHVLVSQETDVLTPTEYDGEGRFRRSKSGRISHFVYYEFGKRMGIARKIDTPSLFT